MKKDRIYLTHNVLNEDICISIIFKAMGIVSHQEMMLICTGSDAEFQDQFALNFEEADRLGVYTQHQALEYLGSKIKIMRKPIGFGGPKRSHAQEALEALASVIIPHVSAKDLNFRPKAMYIVSDQNRNFLQISDRSKGVHDEESSFCLVGRDLGRRSRLCWQQET